MRRRIHEDEFMHGETLQRGGKSGEETEEGGWEYPGSRTVGGARSIADMTL